MEVLDIPDNVLHWTEGPWFQAFQALIFISYKRWNGLWKFAVVSDTPASLIVGTSQAEEVSYVSVVTGPQAKRLVTMETE